jgi:Tfp pilus assembly protein PilX
MKKMRNRQQNGQALLITILVLTIATTIALSLIGRGTIDVNISNQFEESSRAFNAAEAGIEQSLQSGASIASTTFVSGVKYNTNVADIGAATGTYQLLQKTPVGVSSTIWLINHNADNTLNSTKVYTGTQLNVCWSMESAGSRPALVIALIYHNGTTIKIGRKTVDPDSGTRANVNQFATDFTSPNGCGLTNYYQTTFDFTTVGFVSATDTPIAIRIRPEYFDSFLAVNSATTLPKQGNKIDATGTTDSGVSRKVLVYKLYPAPSSVFDYVLYDQSGDLGH